MARIDEQATVTLSLEDWNHVLCCMGERLATVKSDYIRPEVLPAEYSMAYQRIEAQIGGMLGDAVKADAEEYDTEKQY